MQYAGYLSGGEIGRLLPETDPRLLKDLEATINETDCEGVVIATPIDLSRIIDIKKPNTRVYYDLEEIGKPNLGEIVLKFGKKHNLPMR